MFSWVLVLLILKWPWPNQMKYLRYDNEIFKKGESWRHAVSNFQYEEGREKMRGSESTHGTLQKKGSNGLWRSNGTQTLNVALTLGFKESEDPPASCSPIYNSFPFWACSQLHFSASPPSKWHCMSEFWPVEWGQAHRHLSSALTCHLCSWKPENPRWPSHVKRGGSLSHTSGTHA